MWHDSTMNATMNQPATAKAAKTFSTIPCGLSRNVKVWLPVGKRVKICGDAIYRPVSYDADGNRVEHIFGEIVEHLGMMPNCGVAIRFDGYPNVVDYSNRECCNIAALI